MTSRINTSQMNNTRISSDIIFCFDVYKIIFFTTDTIDPYNISFLIVI